MSIYSRIFISSALGTANFLFPETIPCVVFNMANGTFNSEAYSLFDVIPPKSIFESSAEHFKAILPLNCGPSVEKYSF